MNIPTSSELGTQFSKNLGDRAGVPDLSVSGDNSDLVEVDPHDPTTEREMCPWAISKYFGD
jgi:hypothetical protein